MCAFGCKLVAVTKLFVEWTRLRRALTAEGENPFAKGVQAQAQSKKEEE